MNTQELQGQWNKIRGKVKEKWGQLTDDDLQVREGNFDQVVGVIQRKTGEGRERIEQFLDELTSKGGSIAAQAAETVGQYANVASDYAREQFGNVSQHLSQGMEQTKDIVRSRPGQSVAAAFGVGAVLGLVVGLALRSR